MYYQTKEVYPDDKMVMRRYLGPAIDVGNAITYKILLPHGNYVCHSTVCPWTPAEEAKHVFLMDCEKYMSQVQGALGAAFTVGYFEDADLTLRFDCYDDNVKDVFEGTPDKILLPTLEVNNNYVGANVLLPRGENMAQVRVRKRARENDGDPIGRANENTILDRREYVVEFKDGTEAELYANTIAQSMYAQCDPDGNMYFLFDFITNFH